MNFVKKKIKNLGFTIVELIVVIVVIGLLSGMTVLGYGSWRTSTQISQIKSDLNAVAAAMENGRTFDNGYPLSIPSTALPSGGSALTIDPSSTTSKYCVDGTITDNSNVTFYIASETKENGPQEGTCASRAATPDVPPAPIGFIATANSAAQINLSWSVVSGTDITYTVQRSTDNSFVYIEGEASDITATTRSSTGLYASTKYFYRVRAQNAGGSSSWSAVANATTNTLSAPVNFTATATSSTSISQGWDAVSGTGITYTRQRASTAAFTTIQGTSTGSSSTSATSTGLTASTTYFYRVKAVDGGGNESAWSATASATTQP